ncbi:hypothetical protein OIU78_028227 [Salix suchowensis]|nr:hypothetical protein OIU78_028227 [Salix suchowensis]
MHVDLTFQPYWKAAEPYTVLNIERCSITTRTIQKVADALNESSVLAQLSIAKLATLKSFAALNLSGLKLTKPVVDSLCQLAKTSCLSRLMLGSTGIGTDGALQLTASLFKGSQESVKLDLSYCGLMPAYTRILSTDTLICGILELNIAGNPIMQEGTNALVSLLTNPRCCLKVLVLDKCQLGLTGILQMIQALGENDYLEELHLADNANLEKTYMLQYESAKGSSDILQPHLIEPEQQGVCVMNTECNQLEVADSEDGPIREEAAPSDFDDSCTSSCQKEFFVRMSIHSRALQLPSAWQSSCNSWN